MTYDETVEYLFNCAPPFQQVGGAAYKEGLSNTIALDNHLGNPHRKYRTIHIAGTNGKGSSSHTIAAILQAAGYKTGLYTSPHLVDFRERIRVNGIPADKQFVIDFVEKERNFFEPLQPSFFELTTAMAFSYFAREEVDVAIIETGLGGRLDCTNIITPDLSIITNISLDHTQFLGNTLELIANEKAGIIKRGIPVVIGETTPETKRVFTKKAAEESAPIIFAEESNTLTDFVATADGFEYLTTDYGKLQGELAGNYQIKNTATILTALRELTSKGYRITAENVKEGFANVNELTGLMGRWQKLSENPRTVCDAGHNIGGIRYIAEQLMQQQYDTLRIVFGMVSDKDITAVLDAMPKNAKYYFTQASIKRALPAEELKTIAEKHELKGEFFPTVEKALQKAKQEASAKDFIFIGGSCFIVADLLKSINKL